MASTAILMQSKSSRFPNGMGNDHDELGRNLMVHNYRVRVGGDIEGNKIEKILNCRIDLAPK
jgi:hypothetical protein